MRRDTPAIWSIAILAMTLGWLNVPRSVRAEDEPSQVEWRSVIDVGGGFVDDDGMISLLLEQNLFIEGFDAAVSVPLRMRVFDRAPSDSGFIREQDWDDVSDFGRLLRRAAYLKLFADGALDFYLGELNGVGIGHGAVVDHYFNSTDVDHYHGGLLLKAESHGAGGELMLDDVLGPRILVGRAFAAPVSWFIDSPAGARFELGYTLGADMVAPRRVVAQTDHFLLVTGLDVSYALLVRSLATILMYSDLMFMDGDLGLHAGLAGTFVLSESSGLSLGARAEYRYCGPDYFPTLLNPFYERNRYHFRRDENGDILTFADEIGGLDSLPDGHGLMVDFLLEWDRGLRIGARYDRQGRGRPHWLMFRFDLFPWEGYTIGAFYASQDVKGGAEVFTLDSLIGLAMRSRIWGPFDAFAEFQRRYRRVGGEVRYSNETMLGVGLMLVY
ncbi:MAG: hypothetical protein MUC50_00895 [Myxococcota bacterium]|jgi:hypothetical protein|nr:hypothetical protein [Myxococcota bacterium]